MSLNVIAVVAASLGHTLALGTFGRPKPERKAEAKPERKAEGSRWSTIYGLRRGASVAATMGAVFSVIEALVLELRLWSEGKRFPEQTVSGPRKGTPHATRKEMSWQIC
jgi:hypothetical protein